MQSGPEVQQNEQNQQVAAPSMFNRTNLMRAGIFTFGTAVVAGSDMLFNVHAVTPAHAVLTTLFSSAAVGGTQAGVHYGRGLVRRASEALLSGLVQRASEGLITGLGLSSVGSLLSKRKRNESDVPAPAQDEQAPVINLDQEPSTSAPVNLDELLEASKEVTPARSTKRARRKGEKDVTGAKKVQTVEVDADEEPEVEVAPQRKKRASAKRNTRKNM